MPTSLVMAALARAAWYLQTNFSYGFSWRMRTISGVILGYLIFAVPAFLLFPVTHHDPHAPASISFEIPAIAYGIFFAFLAGYCGNAIAGRCDMLVAIIIAVIIALIALASMIAMGVGWSPVSAIVFNIPSELLGGYLLIKRRRRT